jgi:hypothetical protein
VPRGACAGSKLAQRGAAKTARPLGDDGTPRKLLQACRRIAERLRAFAALDDLVTCVGRASQELTI